MNKEKVLHIDSIDGALNISFGTTNAQVASYALRLASFELDKKICEKKMKQEVEDAPRIMEATDIVSMIRSGR